MIEKLSSGIWWSCSDTLAEEPAFVSGILHENLDHPDELIVYEIGNESRKPSLKEDIAKP